MDVTIGCVCPPVGGQRPHESDTVTLRETLDFRTAALARKSISWLKTEDPDAGVPDMLAMLSEFYLLNCIEAWSLRDRGKPIEPTRANIRAYLLADQEAAFTVADEADRIYAPLVILPLASRASTSSPPTPTAEPTSATKPIGRKSTPSKPSSTASTPMAATARM